MKVIKYSSEYQNYFESLNRAWVEKYFEMELMDEALLTNPEERILQKGGQIFFVEHQNQIIGTVALLFISNGLFEMAKMAVDEAFQGIGAGKLLCKTAIEEAIKMKAKKLILFTNSSLKTAIGIYHKFGFKGVPLDGQEFSRADTKMELLLNLEPDIKWFERRFEFNLCLEDFPNLIDRLQMISSKLPQLINFIPELSLCFKPAGKWSIKEHIGHLWLLESLWQKRFLEIKEGKCTMSPADLNNSATDSGQFNRYNRKKVLELFIQERMRTIKFLETLNKEDFQNSINHPRLNQPMRIIDLMSFVADHDQHHLNIILKIINNQANV